MSRVNTQTDIDNNPLKLNMILHNMNRISSQNQKLQELLDHEEQIDKLKDAVEVSNSNWEKLAIIAEEVQEKHQKVMAVRGRVREALGKCSEDVNQKIVGEIQNAKSMIVAYESKLKNLVLTENQRTKK